ncbi:MAG: DUF1259 domain-containing protein, partial [Ignavibacteriae bacterium]|nr:DUF1259 domain-containing protein [Ignavibacteriota bacterium]
MKPFVVLISSLLIIGTVCAWQQESTRTGRTSNRDYHDVLLSNVPLPQHNQDWKSVEEVFDRKGTVQGDVFKVTFPRSELKVKMGKVTISPGLALTSWIAFKSMGNETMAMGDLVLLDSEIAPAMKKLIENGFDVSALHNHIIGESPNVMY